MQLKSIEIDDVEIGPSTDTDHTAISEPNGFRRHTALFRDQRFYRNSASWAITPPPLQQCRRETHIANRSDVRTTIRETGDRRWVQQHLANRVKVLSKPVQDRLVQQCVPILLQHPVVEQFKRLTALAPGNRFY